MRADHHIVLHAVDAEELAIKRQQVLVVLEPLVGRLQSFMCNRSEDDKDSNHRGDDDDGDERESQGLPLHLSFPIIYE